MRTRLALILSLTATPALAQSESVVAVQYGDRPDSSFDARGFGLTAKPLLGRYGLTASNILAELAPHLTQAVPHLTWAQAEGRVVHEYYELRFGPYPLAGAYLHLHHFDNRLVMMRASLPDYRLPSTVPTETDFLPLTSLGIVSDEGTAERSRAVIADFSGLASPAWELTRHITATGATETLIVEAQTGAVLQTRESTFDVANVYEKGPKDDVLVSVDLPGLPGTGYLDGKDVLVFAPSEADPRAQAPDNVFDFLPHDPADALSFDQVQAYYGATRALRWFQDQLGFEPGTTPIKVRVNDVINGKPDAASYTPPPRGPEVRLGAGNDSLTNLARDTDVVTHELTHHLLFPYVTSSLGESGIIHEGTSDYFAYALNGDPYLGESIVPGKPYLRTAALDDGDRFDEADEDKPTHTRGQYWSAVLWSLRQSLGESFDKTVYASFPYLGPNASLRDAFLALLNADRDLNPRPSDDEEAGIYGLGKCKILNAAVARGFASYLDGLQGESCGLDLAALAEESRNIRQGIPRTSGASQSVTLFGKTCSVVRGTSTSGNVFTTLIMLLMLGSPVVSASLLFRKRGGRGHGS